MSHRFFSSHLLTGLMLSLALVISLFVTMPATALAENLPGYESYKEGHAGYLGHGIPKAGEDSMAELAGAVQNPVTDLISISFQKLAVPVSPGMARVSA